MNYEQEIKELEAKIKELKAEIEADKEAPPVWKPEDGETYYTPRSHGVGRDPWVDNSVDKYYLKIGKVFKTEQEAEDYDRALTLIETIRRERYKAQGHWWPSEGEVRFAVSWYQNECRIGMRESGWALTADVFGGWKDLGALQGVMRKYGSELKWYFTEYLPSIN